LRGVRHEHEYEPQYGLPERLPADEQVLWQGAPALAPMMRHVFHLRALAVYFVLMLALRAVAIWPEIQGMGDLLVQLAWAVALAALGWGMVAVLARMTWSSLRWTPDREARIVEFTERVGAWLTECCSELQPRPEAAAEPAPEAAREPDKGARV
jgi:hypothetical protein